MAKTYLLDSKGNIRNCPLNVANMSVWQIQREFNSYRSMFNMAFEYLHPANATVVEFFGTLLLFPIYATIGPFVRSYTQKRHAINSICSEHLRKSLREAKATKLREEAAQ